MARFSLGGGAPDPSPMLHNHLYRHHKPFHLTTLSCIAIVLCGLGASLSIMVLFWCFRSRGDGGGGGDRRRRGQLGIGPSVSQQERAARAKAAVGLLPVITSDDAQRRDECCSVCLAEFGTKKTKNNSSDEESGDREDEESRESGRIEEWEIRVLPGCGHCFHTQCIQLWLCSYLSCPLCRRAIATASKDDDRAKISIAAATGDDCRASSSGSLCDRDGQRNRSSLDATVTVDNCECG